MSTNDTASDTLQTRVFIEGEGDRWFERNRHALLQADWTIDAPLRLLDAHALQPAHVLEVGAANGYRLAALRARFGCEACGIDASAAAVADGMARFPGVHLQTAPSHSIPFADSAFDLVIANFVLHWVDRALLLRTLAEIDRVLVDGGHLLIGDFLPDEPTRRPYHHLPGRDVYTYKQDYAAAFLATHCYESVGMLSGAHSPDVPAAAVTGRDRIGTHLLRKRLHGPHVEDAQA